MIHRRSFITGLVSLIAAPAMLWPHKIGKDHACAMDRCVNVLDYGADPTGRFDSTEAFQAAINDLHGTAVTLLFPPGFYR